MGKAIKLFESKIDSIIENVIKKLHEDNEGSDARRRELMVLLNDDSLNKAPLAYYLFPNETEDGARSLLSKKRRGAPNDSGGHYYFDDGEVTQAINFLKK